MTATKSDDSSSLAGSNSSSSSLLEMEDNIGVASNSDSNSNSKVSSNDSTSADSIVQNQAISQDDFDIFANLFLPTEPVGNTSNEQTTTSLISSFLGPSPTPMKRVVSPMSLKQEQRAPVTISTSSCPIAAETHPSTATSPETRPITRRRSITLDETCSSDVEAVKRSRHSVSTLGLVPHEDQDGQRQQKRQRKEEHDSSMTAFSSSPSNVMTTKLLELDQSDFIGDPWKAFMATNKGKKNVVLAQDDEKNAPANDCTTNTSFFWSSSSSSPSRPHRGANASAVTSSFYQHQTSSVLPHQYPAQGSWPSCPPLGRNERNSSDGTTMSTTTTSNGRRHHHHQYHDYCEVPAGMQDQDPLSFPLPFFEDYHDNTSSSSFDMTNKYPPLPPLNQAPYLPARRDADVPNLFSNDHDHDHSRRNRDGCYGRYSSSTSYQQGGSSHQHQIRPRFGRPAAPAAVPAAKSRTSSSTTATVVSPPPSSASSSTQPYLCREILSLKGKEDENWLSEFLCFVRTDCVEVFTASETDVRSRMNSKKVLLGQAGIRCRYCAHRCHRERAGRSSSYPSSLSRIYQSLTMMLRDHFTQCKDMPHDIKEKYISLKSNASQGATDSKKYWVESARGLGLVDTEKGIRFLADNNVQARCHATTEVMEGNEHEPQSALPSLVSCTSAPRAV